MKPNLCCITIFAVFIILLFSVALAYTCEEKEGVGKKPEVTVTLYYVPEKFACRHTGYANGLAQGSPCKKWTIEEFLAKAERDDHMPVFSKVPPSEIKLERLFGRISNYSKSCSKEDLEEYCMNVDDRRSIVMIFTVHIDNPEGLQISLRRLPSARSKIPGQQKTKRPYTLQAGGRWLTHQRADVFLPSKFFSWCLAIGDWRWVLGSK
jgi:hypothetical protein